MGHHHHHDKRHSKKKQDKKHKKHHSDEASAPPPPYTSKDSEEEKEEIIKKDKKRKHGDHLEQKQQKNKMPRLADEQPQRAPPVEEDGNENEEEEDGEEEEINEPLFLSPDEQNNEEIMVDFEVKQVQDDDFWGIELHVQRLLQEQPFNASQLADLIVKEKDLTSVVKVTNNSSRDQEDSEEDSEEEDRPQIGATTLKKPSAPASSSSTAAAGSGSTPDPFSVFSEIFAVISVINYRAHKDEQWLKQLTEYILSNCPDENKTAKLRQVLSDAAASPLGLLINERVLNLPPQLAPPLNINLFKEIAAVGKTRKDIRFDNFLIISKVYREIKSKKSAEKKSKPEESSPLNYYKIEEEFYHKHASLSFTFPIKDTRSEAVDPAISQEKLIMVVSRQNIPKIIEDMKQALGSIVDLD